MLSSLRHCGRSRVSALVPPSVFKQCTTSSESLLFLCLFRGYRESPVQARYLKTALSSGELRSRIPASTFLRQNADLLEAKQQRNTALISGQREMSSHGSMAPLEHRTDFFQATNQVNKDHFLIVLNYSLPSFVPRIWEQSALRICADGGANRIYDELPSNLKEEDPTAVRERFMPNAIIGDLDSIRPEVRDFYQQHDVPVIDLAHDQDTSDLHKCIHHAQTSGSGLTPQSKILVVGAVGGRLDHQLSNIHILYKFKELRIVLLGRGNLAFLLPEGFEHTIVPDRGVEGPICALIPVGTPVSDVHTTGLRWNLEGRSLQFGELISTSNEFKEDQVTVRAGGSLLWTTELTHDNLK